MIRPLYFLISLFFCYGLFTQPVQALDVDLQVMQRLVTLSEGLSIEKLTIRLDTAADSILNQHAIRPTEKITYVFEHPSGFKLTAGKANFDISLQIRNSVGEIIKDVPSIYGDLKPGNPEGLNLTVTLDPLALGLESDQSYLISLRLVDRNSQHFIEAQHRLAIRKDAEHPKRLIQTTQSFHKGELEVTEQALGFERAYIMDRASLTILEQLNVQHDQKVALVIEGVSGISSLNKMAFPVLEMTVIDQTGKTVYYNPDLMDESGEKGLDPALVSKSLSANLTFYQKQPAGRYLWGLRIYDRFGKGQISAKAWLTLVP